MASYTVSIDRFEGPLDLLLQLIQKHKMEITEISISAITQQYMDTIAEMDMDMDVASEFLAMAATLLYIKSRALLPKPPAQQDPDALTPEQALVLRLEEYRRFKQMSERLLQLESGAQGNYYKLAEEHFSGMQEDILIADMDELCAAFSKALARKPPASQAPAVRQIKRESVSVSQCIRALRATLKREKIIRFEQLFSERDGRMQWIGNFLALLEMMHRHEVLALQSKSFASIRIALRDSQDTQEEENG